MLNQHELKLTLDSVDATHQTVLVNSHPIGGITWLPDTAITKAGWRPCPEDNYDGFDDPMDAARYLVAEARTVNLL